ncbi:hypothetical protein BH11MYX3_BH11MYX3_27500 [soil metagenome]
MSPASAVCSVARSRRSPVGTEGERVALIGDPDGAGVFSGARMTVCCGPCRPAFFDVRPTRTPGGRGGLVESRRRRSHPLQGKRRGGSPQGPPRLPRHDRSQIRAVGLGADPRVRDRRERVALLGAPDGAGVFPAVPSGPTSSASDDPRRSSADDRVLRTVQASILRCATDENARRSRLPRHDRSQIRAVGLGADPRVRDRRERVALLGAPDGAGVSPAVPSGPTSSAPMTVCR